MAEVSADVGAAATPAKHASPGLADADADADAGTKDPAPAAITATDVVDAAPPTLPASAMHWNPLSFATVGWLTPLMLLGHRKPLLEEDLPSLRPEESAELLASWGRAFAERASSQAGAETVGDASPGNNRRPPRPKLLAMAFYQAAKVALNICSSLLIGQVVDYIQGSRDGLIIQNGYGLSFLFFAVAVAYAVFSGLIQSSTYLVQSRVKSAIVCLVYEKVLRASPVTLRDFPPGKINSFVGMDVTSIQGFFLFVHQAWALPAQMAVSLYFLSRYLGVSISVAAGSFIAFQLPPLVLFPLFTKVYRQNFGLQDQRATLLREFLYAVKLVKYHAAEPVFERVVGDKREEQLRTLLRACLLFACLLGLALVQIQLVPALTFVAFGALGNRFDASVVFTSLSFLLELTNLGPYVMQMFQLSYPSERSSLALASIANAIVSLKRIEAFLLAEELADRDLVARLPHDPAQPAVHLVDASFRWEAPDPGTSATISASKDDAKLSKSSAAAATANNAAATADQDVFGLQDLTLSVPVGALVAVVGDTGSGKSSLLSALAGNMRRTPVSSGVAEVRGTVAYCPQEPWILSGSVLDNLRVAQPPSSTAASKAVGIDADEDLFDALRACSLEQDVAGWKDGARTQVGEKGLSLSGGQKARVALARALVSRADVFLLDDPLAALDAHVSAAVFRDVVVGPALAGKTVLLATHLLHLVPRADLVVVVRGGRVAEAGTYDDLISRPGGALAAMMEGYRAREAEEKEEEEKKEKEKERELGGGEGEPVEKVPAGTGDEKDSAKKGGVAVAEDRNTGMVGRRTLYLFADAFGFHWLGVFVVVLGLSVACQAQAQLTLARWSDDPEGSSSSRYYLYVYLAYNLASSVSFST
ncbi:hypothetical protein HK405_007743 [Cladochytrium tenue]|nr:hypothetical protein HK405_007743 [Cladochytrium tenue]